MNLLPADVSTRLTVLVNRTILHFNQIKGDRLAGDLLQGCKNSLRLRCACVFSGFSEHSAAVQRVVNDFSNGGRFGIHVHSVARF
jgi:hypothetical protein